MSLTLMYITNNPSVAEIAQSAGVDRVWVYMEYIGKDERQSGLDTVKSRHTIEDVEKIRSVASASELLVRINPIHEKTSMYLGTEEEVERTIAAGADVLMLPYFKSASEVERYVGCVNGRAKTMILVETAEAVENINSILDVPGIDEVHIGLNDLHLAYGMDFMFELLCDGTVEKLCNAFRKRGLKYGFGGIARVGFGLLPAEYVIAEHYSLGSSAAILSRDFCNANKIENVEEIRAIFNEGIAGIRSREEEASHFTSAEFAANHQFVVEKTREIAAARRARKAAHE